MNDRRLGRFFISMEAIELASDVVRRLMGQCVILRAEYQWDIRAFEYVAVSELFPRWPESCVAPTYEIDTDDQGLFEIHRVGTSETPMSLHQAMSEARKEAEAKQEALAAELKRIETKALAGHGFLELKDPPA